MHPICRWLGLGARACAFGGAVGGATTYLYFSDRQDGRAVVMGCGMHRWWICNHGAARMA